MDQHIYARCVAAIEAAVDARHAHAEADAKLMVAVDELTQEAQRIWGPLRNQTRFVKVSTGACYAVRFDGEGRVSIDDLPAATIVYANLGPGEEARHA